MSARMLGLRTLSIGRPALLAVYLCAALASGCAALASAAGASTVASIKPSFAPERLGASSAFTLALSFGGDHQRVPAPVRSSVVHLPAGIRFDLHGVGICQPARLRTLGLNACPASSVVGRGHALMEAELGALVITESSTVEAYRGPNRGGRSVLVISGQGLTPLIERVTFSGVVVADHSPYGVKLVMSIPPIPTVPTEPDASTATFSVTFGGAGTHRSIKVPKQCPAGGFPFAADFGFADGSATSVGARVACP